VATFHNGEQIKATNGNLIHAHQPHIFKQGSTYYWYGSSKVGTSTGTAGVVNLYTSTDLSEWKEQGKVYESHNNYVARVSMLGKNPKSGKYVLWAKGGGKNFQVATSSSLTGPFSFIRTCSPTGGPDLLGDDMQAMHDTRNGNAFLVYTAKGVKKDKKSTGMYKIHVIKLDVTWTSLASDPHLALDMPSREAPAPFYSPSAKKFYIWTSKTTGWDPNAALCMTNSQGWMSTFKSIGNPTGDSKTFNTQGSHILYLETVNMVDRYLYMGDIYKGYICEGCEGSRYKFLPLEVHSNGNVYIKNLGQWDVNSWPSMGSDELAMNTTAVMV
jgi:hypothetical protein